MKTIQSVAETMYKNLEQNTRDDGSKYYSLKDREEWQVDIIRESHLDRMPNDDIYDRINDILSVLADMDAEACEDDAQDVISGIEADIYTADLTTWLASHNANVEYLDEAQGIGSEGGSDLLMTAQWLYIQAIGQALLSGIVEYIDGLDEEETCNE